MKICKLKFQNYTILPNSKSLKSAVCSFSFTYLFLVVFAFPRIQVVLRREYYDGMYALGAAFLAETLAGLPFLLLMPAAFGEFFIPNPFDASLKIVSGRKKRCTGSWGILARGRGQLG